MSWLHDEVKIFSGIFAITRSSVKSFEGHHRYKNIAIKAIGAKRANFHIGRMMMNIYPKGILATSLEFRILVAALALLLCTSQKINANYFKRQ